MNVDLLWLLIGRKTAVSFENDTDAPLSTPASPKVTSESASRPSSAEVLDQEGPCVCRQRSPHVIAAHPHLNSDRVALPAGTLVRTLRIAAPRSPSSVPTSGSIFSLRCRRSRRGRGKARLLVAPTAPPLVFYNVNRGPFRLTPSTTPARRAVHRPCLEMSCKAASRRALPVSLVALWSHRVPRGTPTRTLCGSRRGRGHQRNAYRAISIAPLAGIVLFVRSRARASMQTPGTRLIGAS